MAYHQLGQRCRHSKRGREVGAVPDVPPALLASTANAINEN